MKPKIYFSVALAGALSLTACHNDEADKSPVAPANPVEVNFQVKVNSGLETRAGRPLYSYEALQQVNNLQLLLFKDGRYDQTVQVTEGFGNTAPNAGETFTFRFLPLLSAGTYTFLAAGFEEEVLKTYVMPDLEGKTIDDAILTLADGADADEFFVGLSGEYTVSETTKSMTAEVELRRAVAGVLGYFENIPYRLVHNGQMTQVEKVCVELSCRATAVNLRDRSANAKQEAVYRLLEIDLTGEKRADDGNYFACPAVTEGAYTKVANSYLAGGYTLPYTATDGATLKVVIRGAGDVVLKSYPVIAKQEARALPSAFDIEADHFYGVGRKSKDTSDPGDDDPIDLSKDQVITISVDAAWATVHRLDLDTEE